MKTVLKKSISVFLAFIFVFGTAAAGLSAIDFGSVFETKASAAATKYTEGDYKYTVENGEATIVDFSTSVTGEITVPATLGGYPVTVIGEEAFQYASDITSINLPSGIKTIAVQAFDGCSAMTSISIPNTVTSIDIYAFKGCDELESIHIPSSVTHLGREFLSGCKSLTSITVDEYNTEYSSDSYGVLFNKDKSLLIAYPGANNRTSYEIPNTVLSIGIAAFQASDNLTNITFEENSKLKLIGQSAFSCDRLKSITIPDSVVTIEDSAFFGCDSLTAFNLTTNSQLTSIGFRALPNVKNIYIPKNVSDINENAWESCDTITVDADNLHYSSDEYGVLFNKDKTELLAYPENNTRTSYTVPNTVTTLSEYSFSNSENLESLTIPNSVTSIEYSAFSSSSLSTLSIPDSVTTIGDTAFYASNISNISLPDSITYIGMYAFSSTPLYNNADNWENDVLYVDNHLIAAKYTFSSESYDIKAGTKTIAYQAFLNKTSLTEITIPGSVTSINYGAFQGCSSLKTVTIEKSSQLKTIGINAFYLCSSLETADLKNCNHLQEIGDYAFYLTKLADIYFPDSVSKIGYHTVFSTPLYNNSEKWEDNCLYIGNHLVATKGGSDLVIKEGTLTVANIDITVTAGNITIPSSVKYFGFNQNYGTMCSKFIVDPANQHYSNDSSGALFNKDKTVLIKYPTNNTQQSYTIPNTVKTIGSYAFNLNYNIKNVVISENVKNIEDYAFFNCNLESINIPSNVEIIGNYAFYGCQFATSITISEGVSKIGNQAFCNCKNVSSVILPDSVTEIGEEAFRSCEVLNSLHIPSSVSRIEFINFNAYFEGSITAYSDSAAICSDQKDSFIHAYALISDINFSVCSGHETGSDTPDTPDTPDNPDEPDVPDTPDTPDTPDEPDTPDNPDAPLIGNSFHIIWGDMVFNNNGSITINYEETIRLSVMLPAEYADYTVVWESSDSDIAPVVNGNITAVGDGTVTIKAYLVDSNGNKATDENGNEISQSIKLTCKLTFWQKIIAFFKKLFASLF